MVENFVKLWPKLIKEPDKTLKAKTGTLYDAAVLLTLTSFLLTVIWISSILLKEAMAGGEIYFVPLPFILFFIFWFIPWLLTSFAGVILYFLVAKLFRGKGRFGESAYTYGLVVSLIPLVMLVDLFRVLLFWANPRLSLIIAGLFLILSSLYLGHLMVKAIKIANSLKTRDSVAVVAIVIIFGLILDIILPP